MIVFLLVEELSVLIVFFFQAEDGIRDLIVTGVQTCALPISFACSAAAPKAQPQPAQVVAQERALAAMTSKAMPRLRTILMVEALPPAAGRKSPTKIFLSKGFFLKIL